MATQMYKRTIDRFAFALANATSAIEGRVAALNASTGKVVPITAATGLRAIGFFAEDLTGDGTTKVTVQLFDEINVYKMLNDGTSPVTTVGTICYLTSGTTVQADATGVSPAGLVISIDADGAWIFPGVTA